MNINLQCKLGSLIIHAREALSNKGHPFDLEAFNNLLQDNEIQNWLLEMGEKGLLPLER